MKGHGRSRTRKNEGEGREMRKESRGAEGAVGDVHEDGIVSLFSVRNFWEIRGQAKEGCGGKSDHGPD